MFALQPADPRAWFNVSLLFCLFLSWFIYFSHWKKTGKQLQRHNDVRTWETKKKEDGWKPVEVRETEQKGEMNVCLEGVVGWGGGCGGAGAVWVQTKDTVPFTNPDQPPRLHHRCVSHRGAHSWWLLPDWFPWKIPPQSGKQTSRLL